MTAISKLKPLNQQNSDAVNAAYLAVLQEVGNTQKIKDLQNALIATGDLDRERIKGGQATGSFRHLTTGALESFYARVAGGMPQNIKTASENLVLANKSVNGVSPLTSAPIEKARVVIGSNYVLEPGITDMAVSRAALNADPIKAESIAKIDASAAAIAARPVTLLPTQIPTQRTAPTPGPELDKPKPNLILFINDRDAVDQAYFRGGVGRQLESNYNVICVTNQTDFDTEAKGIKAAGQTFATIQLRESNHTNNRVDAEGLRISPETGETSRHSIHVDANLNREGDALKQGAQDTSLVTSQFIHNLIRGDIKLERGGEMAITDRNVSRDAARIREAAPTPAPAP